MSASEGHGVARLPMGTLSQPVLVPNLCRTGIWLIISWCLNCSQGLGVFCKLVGRTVLVDSGCLVWQEYVSVPGCSIPSGTCACLEEARGVLGGHRCCQAHRLFT